MNALLHTDSLTIAAGGRRLVEQLDLTVKPGQCWVVIGRNGSGKTRLLHTLAGLCEAAHGTVSLHGRELRSLKARERARHIGLLLQHSHSGFLQNLLQLVLSGAYPRNRGWETKQDLEAASRALRQLGLERQSEQPLQTLSGGELRRGEIARLLLQNPALAMLDEPLNHLDIAHQVAVLTHLRQHFVAPGQALLMVLHDINLARRIATHMLLLYGNGRWLSGPAAKVGDAERLGDLLGHPLREYSSEHGQMIGLDLPDDAL